MDDREETAEPQGSRRHDDYAYLVLVLLVQLCAYILSLELRVWIMLRPVLSSFLWMLSFAIGIWAF